jgi:branched-chain amino acid transport system permease protein
MQILINGLIAGGGIALLAVGFQAVYLPTRVFYMALAGLYAAAPYFLQALLRLGWPWPVATAIALLGAVGLSLLFEWINHGPLFRKRASDGVHLIASLGLSIITVQLLALIWSNEQRTLRTSLDHVTRVNGLTVTGAQWVTLATSVVLLAGFGWFLRRSNLGLRLRAMADNPTQFALLGFNVPHYRLLSFAVAGLFAGGAALTTAFDVGFDPHVGLHSVLLAIVAVIIGGQGTFLGPILGGLVLGLLRAQVVWHFSARWQDAATFALLGIFLLIRPQGLLGKERRLEAQT